MTPMVLLRRHVSGDMEFQPKPILGVVFTGLAEYGK